MKFNFLSVTLLFQSKRRILNGFNTFCTSVGVKPSLQSSSRELWRIDGSNPFLEIPEAWVTSLDEIDERNHNIIQLHPGFYLSLFHLVFLDIFRVTPRLDILHRNIVWLSNLYIKSLFTINFEGKHHTRI